MFKMYEQYFRVTYPERTLSYPKIEPFVYIGKNLSEEDEGDVWYFEFLQSFIDSDGLNNTEYEGRYCSCVTEKDKEDMLSADQLHALLKQAEKKRAKKTSSN